MSDNYTAWDGNEYPWPPPEGWEIKSDGRYWPADHGAAPAAEAPAADPIPDAGTLGVAGAAGSLGDNIPAVETPSFDAGSFDAPGAIDIPEPGAIIDPGAAMEAPAPGAAFDPPPAMNAPSFDAPQVDTPSFDPPPMGGFDAPQVDAPAMGGFDAPQIDTPSFDPPPVGGFDAPQVDAPAMGGFDAPQVDAPAMGGFDAPQIDAPSFDAPPAPGMGAPDMAPPPIGAPPGAGFTPPPAGGPAPAPAWDTPPPAGGPGAPAPAPAPGGPVGAAPGAGVAPAPPAKKGLSTGLIVLFVILGLLVLGVGGCIFAIGRAADEAGDRIEDFAEGDAENQAAARREVSLSSCSVVDGVPQATGTVANRSGGLSDYFVEVVFTAEDGRRLASGNANVTSVEDGGDVVFDAISTEAGVTTRITCGLGDVTRRAS